MTRVLLLCGGVSAEHEVSLASARSVLAAAPETLQVTPLVIAKTGYIHSPQESAELLTQAPNLDGSDLGPLSAGMTNIDVLVAAVQAHDVVFPILHGPFGEDGTIQGLLRLLGVPFVGSGVLGSSVNMDKIMMKTVFAAHHLPQVSWVGATEHEFTHDPATLLNLCEALAYPLFVKPANLGSSVGISKVTNRAELVQGLQAAFAHDDRVIIETGLTGVQELEIGILGNDEAIASKVGEIRYGAEFYDYRAKYASADAQMIIPADVPQGVTDHITEVALTAFRATGAKGIARVDFFYRAETGEIWLNEINTMPGFTQASMYPVLFQQSGIPYGQLIEKLVMHALA